MTRSRTGTVALRDVSLRLQDGDFLALLKRKGTVVDAKHIFQQLKQSPESKEQIAFADRIVLTKTDVVPDAAALTARVAVALPGGPAASARVKRVNYIDQQIFGKMERDGVPHAPRRAVADEPHRVDRLPGAAGGDHDAHPGEVTTAASSPVTAVCWRRASSAWPKCQ